MIHGETIFRHSIRVFCIAFWDAKLILCNFKSWLDIPEILHFTSKIICWCSQIATFPSESPECRNFDLHLSSLIAGSENYCHHAELNIKWGKLNILTNIAIKVTKYLIHSQLTPAAEPCTAAIASSKQCITTWLCKMNSNTW